MNINATVTVCDSFPLSGRSGYVQSPDMRGTLDILWSCFSALFICLWSMLHLNIPAAGESVWVRFWRRVRWLSLGVLSPEMTLHFACGQWTSARRSVKEMHALGYTDWSISHAFYADMGGFFLETPDHPRKPFPISAKQVAYLVREGYMPLPPISKAEIKDKGNADYVAKSIAYFQTSWLTVQVVARAIQRLPVSLLELGAISMCFCSLATLWFWLEKPLDVETPTYLKIETSAAEIKRRADARIGDVDESAGKIGSAVTCSAYTPRTDSICNDVDPEKAECIFKAPLRTDTLDSLSTLCSDSILNTNHADLDLKLTLPTRTDSILSDTTAAGSPTTATSPDTIFPVEDHIPDTPLEFIEPNVYMSSKVNPRILRFILRSGLQTRPLSRIPDDRDPWLDSISQHVALAVFTAAFCSIPLAGWNFAFATRWEEVLYRSCNVGMWVNMCIYGFAEWALGWSEGFSKMYLDKGRGYKLRWPTNLVFALLFGLYSLFRMGILFEALWSLRNMPNGVFVGVRWTALVPHI